MVERRFKDEVQARVRQGYISYGPAALEVMSEAGILGKELRKGLLMSTVTVWERNGKLMGDCRWTDGDGVLWQAEVEMIGSAVSVNALRNHSGAWNE